MDWFGALLRPLDGGYSGETFLVGDRGAEVVLRIYARRPRRLLIDAALLRLMAGLLPVAGIVDVRPPDGELPGVLVTERLPGKRLDIVLADADADLRSALGRSVGKSLAVLSSIPMLRAGFFVNQDLAVDPDPLFASNGLGAWLESHRGQGLLASWSDDDIREVEQLADTAQELLLDPLGSCSDSLPGPELWRSVLVHGDFNPKNLLVDPSVGALTGVLDWEFAHAGSPYTDLGNIARFERHEDFTAGVLEHLVERSPALVDDPVTLGRVSDLWALVELVGRPDPNPVSFLAERLLRAQARAHDLSAWPWDVPRVDPVGAAPVS